MHTATPHLEGILGRLLRVLSGGLNLSRSHTVILATLLRMPSSPSPLATGPSPSRHAARPASIRREKVAILGGGMASLSAAFALTDTPELRDRYELTVYQDGWLLGG